MPYSLRQIDSFGEISDPNRDPSLKTRSQCRTCSSATVVLPAPACGPYRSPRFRLHRFEIEGDLDGIVGTVLPPLDGAGVVTGSEQASV